MNMPRLDRGAFSRLNFCVRLGVVVGSVCVAFAASAVSAPGGRARGGVTFAVGKGGEALGYLAPELTRAVTAALEAAGGGPSAGGPPPPRPPPRARGGRGAPGAAPAR